MPKAAELVADALRKNIIDGSFADGDVLPSEAQLMQRFNVSRPTLREAIRVLEQERLITVRRGARGGAVVHGMRSEIVSRYAALFLESRGTGLDDLYAAQAIIEPACVALLAESSSQEIVRKLRQALDEEASTLGSEQELADRVSFHTTLIQLSGNQTLSLMSEVISDVLLAIGGREPVGIAAADALEHHRLVVDLIEAREPEHARRLWSDHLHAARVLRTKHGDTTGP
ncbi:FadR/GntR family transcriptional regulator [Streptomyces muensis]|uniref:FCD domain-containing protein n=1 Tax=Streptomyces muensis TaxID=1077944 RepID=A0A9X1TQF3_STRM4|nr:GntR family transcriptional regulator [Streptomyces muensis]MCF1592528.1 FCD domain-containing protein [Streptomyces muensis]